MHATAPVLVENGAIPSGVNMLGEVPHVALQNLPRIFVVARKVKPTNNKPIRKQGLSHLSETQPPSPARVP
jgi:hypothetical protein